MSTPDGAALPPAVPSGSGRKRPKSEKTFIFRVLAFLLVPPMLAIARFKLIDTHKVPESGAFVLAPNHFSEIDPVVVGVAMWKVGRMPRYLTKRAMFKNPIMRWLLNASGQIPVDRAGATRGNDPLAAARQISNNGNAVVIYPEGSLTRDPNLWPMRGKSGAVRMALAADIPVIPVAQWGSQLIMPRYARKLSVFPRKRVEVKFGDPVDLSAYRGRPIGSAELAEATDLVMAAISKLLAELRGEEAPAERWDPLKHNQKETGRFD